MNLEKIFTERIDTNEINIENKTIDVNNCIVENWHISNKNSIIFTNCQFDGKEFVFYKNNGSKLIVYFRECVFNCDVKFNNCYFKALKFINTKKIKTLEITKSIRIEELYFKNTHDCRYKLEGDIIITNNKSIDQINISKINHHSGEFIFTNNDIKKNTTVPTKASSFAFFKKSSFNKADFSETKFSEEVNFDGMVLTNNKGHLNFENCTFGKSYFNETNFGNSAYFNGSIFNNDAHFISCQNIENTIADFSGCTIYKNINFSYSKFKSLIIKNVLFDNLVSFEETEFDNITFERIVFQKPAFFDGIKINNLKNCTRKTLRIIKLQLQKTENKIDYNNFKAFELDALNRELNKKDWKDKFVLWLNSKSSNHGLNWLQGITFTIIVGLVFYSIYFSFENFTQPFIINCESLNVFLIGYFKFLVPSYSSPIENGLSKWYLYIPFLIGKIFVTYGIYQTIVSFRKFKL
ncbi:pentapeptide repeat-containing protein [uncultured Maribacter sp.]|uniref:pentapeptide repeat-containing protein n=1 Tax=uncultured Maribacter sp. TaxID=431308 RepID=UPI002614F541|nr:pentapeptide repeat-containing protein [uncultured Maribacter sp.]